jgi:hypothetical protein
MTIERIDKNQSRTTMTQRAIPLLLSVLLLGCSLMAAPRPRVFISTDIGGGDADDYQSLVHYLVYADMFETEGIIASPPDAQTSDGWHYGRRDSIVAVLNAYAADLALLRRHSPHYPHPDSLLARCFQGAINAQADTLPNPAHLSDQEQPGYRHLIACAQKQDPRPLWVLVWGSMTDVALAVHEQPSIKRSIRLYSIGSWNTYQGDPRARLYLYKNHPDLWWIENDRSFRGMYADSGYTPALSNRGFVATSIAGHGALGNFFVSKKDDIKMGDTPSVLYLLGPLLGGVGSLESPTAAGWGGAFIGDSTRPCYWHCLGDKRNARTTVSRWRAEYLGDWAKRMDRLLP